LEVEPSSFYTVRYCWRDAQIAAASFYNPAVNLHQLKL
jgi:hypothetical protein